MRPRYLRASCSFLASTSSPSPSRCPSFFLLFACPSSPPRRHGRRAHANCDSVVRKKSHRSHADSLFRVIQTDGTLVENPARAYDARMIKAGRSPGLPLSPISCKPRFDAHEGRPSLCLFFSSFVIQSNSARRSREIQAIHASRTRRQHCTRHQGPRTRLP